MLTKIHKIIIITSALVLLAGLIVGGYLYLTKPQTTNQLPKVSDLQQATQNANKITEEVIKTVLPSITTNPLENKPDVNPASKANPIKNIKTNPFD
jgi:uncharacterized protein YneF (UPF0154 family)